LALDLIDLENSLGSGSWSVACALIRGFGEALLSYRAGSAHERYLYFPDWFDSGVNERFGDRVGEYLNDLSPDIVAYSQTRDEVKQERSVVTSREANLASLQSMVDAGARPPQIRSMARRVAQSTKQSKELARLALEHSDPDITAAILGGFSSRDFPLPDDSLMPFVDSENDRLRDITRIILGRTEAEWKREHALDVLRQGQHVDEALELLQASYQAEDEPIVDASIRKVSLRGEDWHSVFMGVLDLFSPADRPVTTGVLDYVYRQTRCSLCRNHLVQLIADKSVLSDDVIEECLLDSYDETREFASHFLSS